MQVGQTAWLLSPCQPWWPSRAINKSLCVTVGLAMHLPGDHAIVCCLRPTATHSMPRPSYVCPLQGAAPFGQDSAKQLVTKVLMGTAVTLPLPVSNYTQCFKASSPSWTVPWL